MDTNGIYRTNVEMIFSFKNKVVLGTLTPKDRKTVLVATSTLMRCLSRTEEQLAVLLGGGEDAKLLAVVFKEKGLSGLAGVVSDPENIERALSSDLSTACIPKDLFKELSPLDYREFLERITDKVNSESDLSEAICTECAAYCSMRLKGVLDIADGNELNEFLQFINDILNDLCKTSFTRFSAFACSLFVLLSDYCMRVEKIIGEINGTKEVPNTIVVPEILSSKVTH